MHCTGLGAGNGKNKLVFGVMHLSNSPRLLTLAGNTRDYVFVVETFAFLLLLSVRRVHDQGRSREVGPVWSGALEAPVVGRGR